MTTAEFAEAERGLRANGFKRVQGGLIQAVPSDLGRRPCFADRAVGFNISLLGTFAPPTYRSQYENRLLDTDTAWAHWRKLRQ